MILFREFRDDINMIHMIVGEETDFQLDMAGNIVVDLDELLDSSKKNILYINRCVNETDLKERIQYYQSMVEGSDNEKSESQEVKKSNYVNYGLKCPKCGNNGCKVIDNVPTMCDTCKRIEEGLNDPSIPKPPNKKELMGLLRKFLSGKDSDE